MSGRWIHSADILTFLTGLFRRLPQQLLEAMDAVEPCKEGGGVCDNLFSISVWWCGGLSSVNSTFWNEYSHLNLLYFPNPIKAVMVYVCLMCNVGGDERYWMLLGSLRFLQLWQFPSLNCHLSSRPQAVLNSTVWSYGAESSNNNVWTDCHSSWWSRYGLIGADRYSVWS